MNKHSSEVIRTHAILDKIVALRCVYSIHVFATLHRSRYSLKHRIRPFLSWESYLNQWLDWFVDVDRDEQETHDANFQVARTTNALCVLSHQCPVPAAGRPTQLAPKRFSLSFERGPCELSGFILAWIHNVGNHD